MQATAAVLEPTVESLDAPPVHALQAAPGEQDPVPARLLKLVKWHDLVAVTRWQAFVEVTLSLPWIALMVVCFWLTQAVSPWWVLGALFASFYVFLTGLRQAHNAYHVSVGISRRGCDWLLYFLSWVMTGSMHVVRLNHLHHHRHSLMEEDVEGFTARLKWWQALLVGPYFPYRLHMFALRTADRTQMRHILFELGLNVVWTAFVAYAALVWGQWWLALMLVTMWSAQSMTGFFAVWTVHHGCDARLHVARTQRGRLKNLISYQMFHHLEHHLFPAVPTCHWHKLGERIDAALPEARHKIVY